MACFDWHARSWRKLLSYRPKHIVVWVEPDDMDEMRVLITKVEEWFASDEAHGWFVYEWIEGINAANRVWRFSDPNTAFVFKMRFG